MASLPDVPIALWRSFQETLFGESADRVESAESFRWGVDDALSSLPPDDGMDWEAEHRRLEEEQRRREEEQRRQIEEQARLDQELYQQQAEERAAQARAAQMSMYAPPPAVEPYDPRQYDQGPHEAQPPPSPEQPASFADTVGGLWQQTFGAAPPPPGPPPEAEPPPEPEAPPLGFADTVSSLWTQTFGSDVPDDELAAPPPYEGPSYAPRTREQAGLPPIGVTEPIERIGATLGEAAEAGGRAILRPVTLGPEDQPETEEEARATLQRTMPDPFSAADREAAGGLLPTLSAVRRQLSPADQYNVYQQAQEETADVIGRRAGEGAGLSDETFVTVQTPWGPYEVSQQDVAGFAAQAALDPFNLVGGGAPRVAASAARAAAPVVREGAEAGIRAAGRAGYALAEEGARQLMDLTPTPRMVQPGEAAPFRARPGNLPEELVPRAEPGGGRPWEPTAAERAEVARQDAEIAGRPPHAGYRASDVVDAERATSATPSPLEVPSASRGTVFEPPAAARAGPPPTAPPATPRVGDRIVLPDGGRGVVGSLGQQRRGGQTLSWMTVRLEGGGSRQIQLPPAGAPTAAPPRPPGAGTPGGGRAAPPGMYTTVGPPAPPGPPARVGPPGGGGPPAPGGPPAGGGGGGAPPVGQMYTGQRPPARGTGGLESLRRWIVREHTDRRVDLNELQNDVAREIGRPLNADELVSELSRRNTNQAAHVQLLEGLRPALLRAGADQEQLSEALTYLDNIAVSQALGTPNRTFSWGLTAADSQQRLVQLVNQLGGAGSDRVTRLNQGIQDVRAFTDAYRKRMLDSGVWSQELYNDLTTRYPTYIPTRIVDYLKNDQAIPSGRKLGLNDRGLRSHTLAGTALEREDPLASITRLAYESEKRIRQNEAFNAFVRLREASPQLQQAITPVAASYTPKHGETVVHGFVGGVKQAFAMSDPIAMAVKMDDGASLPGFATAIPNAIRALITHSPTFVAGQVPLDFYAALTRESGRQGGPQAVPRVAIELFKAYGEAFRGLLSGEFRGDAARLLKEGGGMAGYQGRSMEASASKLAELGHANMFEIRHKGDLVRLLKWMATAQPVAAVGQRFELAPRIASYRLAGRRTTPQTTMAQLTPPGGGAPIPIPQQGRRQLSEVERVMAARDITLDFERGGRFARTLNQFIPFYNVGWQSSAAIKRAFRENPLGFTASALSLVGGPTLAAEAWNRADPQREKDYEDVPDYVKDRGVVIMWPGTAPVDKDGNRRPNYSILPLREFAPIAIATREAAQRVIGKSQRGWAEVLGAGIAAASPIQATGAEDLFSSFNPAGLSTLGQVASDRDFFRGQRINTKFRSEEASAASKAIAAAARSQGLEMSPAQVEFVLRDLGGGAAKAGLAASDMLAGKARDDSRLQSTPLVGDLIRRFVGDTTGGVMEREREQTIRPATRAKLRAGGVEYVPAPADFEIGQMPLRRSEVGDLQARTNRYVEENVNRLLADPVWSTLTPAERQRGVEYQVSLARQRAKGELLDRISAAEANQRAAEAAARKAGAR